jgi:hypothetical protein
VSSLVPPASFAAEFAEAIDVQPGGHLRVERVRGSIEITSHASDRVVVEARARGDLLRPHTSGGRIEVRAI